MRLILIKLHWILGLTGGAVLCVIALTGALYAYEPQLRAWWGEPVQQVAEDRLLSPMALEASLRASGLEGRGIWFLWPEEEDLPTWVGWEDAAGRRLDFMVDPASGERLPRAEQAQAFFRAVLDLHRTLAAGAPGKWVVGMSAIALLALTVSGLLIAARRWRDAPRVWWPSSRERGQRRAWPRWRMWHRILGAWLAPWLLLMPLTGLVWSFDAYADFIRWLGGPARFSAAPEVASPPEVSPGALAAIWERGLAERAEGRPMRLALPTRAGQAARFEWSPEGVASFAMRSRLYFDPRTGSVLEAQRWEAFSAGEQAARWAFPLHTGRLWGAWGQTAAFFGALSLPFFFASGLYLYVLRRRRSKRETFTNESSVCTNETSPSAP